MQNNGGFLMKRLFLIAGLTTALVLAAVAVSAGSAANFGGTWVMDKAKSQGLDPRMQNAESVSCVIVQDDKTLSIEWKVVAGQPPAGAPSGGGGGRGPAGPRTYNLDGKEVTSDAGGQTGGTNTVKATWSSDGKTLELSTVRTGSRDGQEFKITTVDKLSISEDGKVMTVNRHNESPMGTRDSTYVLNKQ
jgi:hypothetical protein